MRIVNFIGGLGNQMFEYAFFKYLTTLFPHEKIYGAYWSGSLNIHEGLEIEKVFNINLPPHNWITDQISRFYTLLERYHFIHPDEEHTFSNSCIVFNGYWLDKFYYRNQSIQELFSFRNTDVGRECEQIKKQIENVNSVSVHIRRGDYLSAENYRNFGQFCTLEYYKRAIEKVKENIVNPYYFIFSDDIEWAKTHLRLNNAVCVDCNKEADSWKDMYLMSLCKSNIIANSTFSYWAAMLNKNEDKLVTYPHQWYIWENPDIFPDSWISI